MQLLQIYIEFWPTAVVMLRNEVCQVSGRRTVRYMYAIYKLYSLYRIFDEVRDVWLPISYILGPFSFPLMLSLHLEE